MQPTQRWATEQQQQGLACRLCAHTTSQHLLLPSRHQPTWGSGGPWGIRLQRLQRMLIVLA